MRAIRILQEEDVWRFAQEIADATTVQMTGTLSQTLIPAPVAAGLVRVIERIIAHCDDRPMP
jgi:hypothetical protein